MVRFGIIGTGRIAKRFMKEMEHVEEAVVAAVYNPHEGHAAEFVGALQDEVAELLKSAAFGLSAFSKPVATSNIEEFWNLIDAVYIASPHSTHFEYTIMGKHVLCEKPMLLTEAEGNKAFKLADKKGLVLMEGLKTAYCPGFNKVLQLVDSGIIGQVKHVSAAFTKLTGQDGREFNDKGVAGSFIELGSYGMLAVFSLLGYDYRDVSFNSLNNSDGVDIYTVASFEYDGAIGTVISGLGAKTEGQLLIAGTEGYIRVQAPWWQTRHIEVCFEDPSKTISYEQEFAGDGLRYEIRAFVDRINGENLDQLLGYNRMSLEMGKVVEKLKQ